MVSTAWMLATLTIDAPGRQLQEGLLREPERAAQVDLQHAQQIGLAVRLDRLEDHHAGVVDDDVEPAEARESRHRRWRSTSASLATSQRDGERVGAPAPREGVGRGVRAFDSS